MRGLISILIGLLTFLAVNFQTNFTTYESLSIGLFAYAIIDFVDNLGKKLNILDIITLPAIFQYLIMPIASYHHFNRENFLARLWARFMWVPSDTYYDFMFPCTIALIIGLKLPLFFRSKMYKDQIDYKRGVFHYVGKMKWEGLSLVAIGIIASLFVGSVPSSLGHVFFLLSYLLFIGIFYCLYSDFPMKKIVLWSGFGFLILRSVFLGMFGELIFMCIMATILLTLGVRISLLKKCITLAIASFVVLLIQVVKPEYRDKIWFNQDSEQSNISLFIEIISEKITDPSAIFSNEAVWFNIYSRFNQGLYVGLVQRTVPAKLPYANGETINESIAGAIVPRLLWPDKQTSGGTANFKRFLGYDLKGYSVGISPYGEAWGNYGRTGGIIFMFVFGLMFNFIFSWILKIAVGTPSLILWLPLMFFYAVKIESDVFSMVNSLFKACMFTFIMYKLYPLFFRGRL